MVCAEMKFDLCECYLFRGKDDLLWCNEWWNDFWVGASERKMFKFFVCYICIDEYY